MGCEAGCYTTDDTDAYGGVVTKATNYSDCPAGYHQASVKSVYCSPCNAGTSSDAASAVCTTCAAGTASSTGSATCTAGYYQSAT